MMDPTTPPAPLPARDRWRLQTKRALLTCVALFAGANVVLPLLLLGSFSFSVKAVVGYTMMGLFCAQLGLHAIWCVLASGSLAKRLAWAIAAGLFLFAALLPGLLNGDSFVFFSVFVGTLPFLPLIVVAVQTPLWIASGFFGWRIVHRRDPARRSPIKRMGIRHLLIATGVLAAALSAARVGLTMEDSALRELVLFVVVMAGATLFTLPPTIAATLRIRRTLLAVLAVLAICVAALGAWVLILSGVLHSIVSQGVWIGILLVLATYFACLAGPLVLLRRLGYRLYWSRR